MLLIYKQHSNNIIFSKCEFVSKGEWGTKWQGHIVTKFSPGLPGIFYSHLWEEKWSS